MGSTRYTLAADVGGTKTLLELGAVETGEYRTLHTAHFINAEFSGVEEICEAFLASAHPRRERVDAACFALAGPIVGKRVRLTNLPWEIDSDALASRLKTSQVRLVNDFAAVGHGIPRLTPNELKCLQAGRQDAHGVRGVLGAGTGLGMAMLVWTGTGYKVVPSEGGNADFAPVNEVQSRLWSYLAHRLERVWCGALLSGRGLERIYQFLSEADTLRVRTSGGRAQESGLAAADITHRAVEGSDPRAVSTVNLFLEIYGAVAGNLALTVMAHGGIYVAGGIAPRIAHMFTEAAFMRGFHAKGKFSDLMRSFPVNVVLTPEVGLRGAVAIAIRLATRHG